MNLRYLSLLALLSAFHSTAFAKTCDTNPILENCEVRFFCAEIEPFLIPIEVEVWESEKRFSIHKFAVHSDGNRSAVGDVGAIKSESQEKIEFAAHTFPEFDLKINEADGMSEFTEKIMGRTIITPMLCLEPVL